MNLPLTPVQTVGPYFTLGMVPEGANVLVKEGTEGERIRIEGRLFGRDGEPLRYGMIEIWQANAAGRYQHPLDQRPLPLDPEFLGFGRVGVDEEGDY